MPEKSSRGWSFGTGQKRIERKETGVSVKKDIRQPPKFGNDLKRGGTHTGAKRGK